MKTPFKSLLLAAALSIRLSAAAAEQPANPGYFPPPDSAGGWRTATNAASARDLAGMNMDRLEQASDFTQRCTQNGGLLVVRKGHLVFEDYFGRASRKVKPDRASTGKAYTSIACGIMLKEFHDQIPDGLDTKVFTPRFLPEAFSPDGRLDDERRADITLGQLLCMTGGYNGQYDPTFTRVPQPEPDHSRDDWKPIPSTPFNERSLGGDDGIRRVLEMVCAAVRE